MATHIALLRGINVGGRNQLPMAELRSLLGELGAREVKTYIQSGNAVFSGEIAEPDRFAQQISDAIDRRHGFAPKVVLLTSAAWRQAMADNPFPEGESEPKTLHLYFLASAPTAPDLEKLEAIRRKSERFHLAPTVFYLHAPEGVGRSKLAVGVEGALGVPMTARNWRSVEQIWALAEPGADDAA